MNEYDRFRRALEIFEKYEYLIDYDISASLETGEIFAGPDGAKNVVTAEEHKELEQMGWYYNEDIRRYGC